MEECMNQNKLPSLKELIPEDQKEAICIGVDRCTFKFDTNNTGEPLCSRCGNRYTMIRTKLFHDKPKEMLGFCDCCHSVEDLISG